MKDRRDFLKRAALAVGGVAAVDPLGLLLKPVAPPTPGSWLEFDERGIPYRMSLDPSSPYFYPDGHPKLACTVDGKRAGCCLGYDRRRGYVECRPVLEKRWWYEPGAGWPTIVPETDPRRWDIVRHYGKVEVTWA